MFASNVFFLQSFLLLTLLEENDRTCILHMTIFFLPFPHSSSFYFSLVINPMYPFVTTPPPITNDLPQPFPPIILSSNLKYGRPRTHKLIKNDRVMIENWFGPSMMKCWSIKMHPFVRNQELIKCRHVWILLIVCTCLPCIRCLKVKPNYSN